MNKKHTILLISSIATLVVFILFTSPYRLPLLLLVVPGTAFMCAAYTMLQLLLHKLKLGNTPRRLLVAVTMASLFVTGILLSLGQLTPRDFFLLLSFTLIGTFYIQRMWDTKR